MRAEHRLVDLKQSGVEFVHTNKPQTDPRVCACEGCDNIFRPTPRQVRAGYGKFCSRKCDHEAHRLYEQPAERACDREGCGNRFTPTGSNVAYGWGKYCSRRCSALSTAAHQKEKGRTVACAQCGRDHSRYDSQLKDGVTLFCNRSCWGKYRWKHGVVISPDLVSLVSGRARQK